MGSKCPILYEKGPEMIVRGKRGHAEDDRKKITVRVDAETHRRLKVFCARTTFSMNEVIVGLVEEMLRKDSARP